MLCLTWKTRSPKTSLKEGNSISSSIFSTLHTLNICHNSAILGCKINLCGCHFVHHGTMEGSFISDRNFGFVEENLENLLILRLNIVPQNSSIISSISQKICSYIAYEKMLSVNNLMLCRSCMGLSLSSLYEL